MTRRAELAIPPIAIDRASGIPVYRQLAVQLAAAIRAGTLDGARLPSTRLLAAALGVSRNTVFAAFDELVAQGLIEGRRGSGTSVPHDGRPASCAPAPQSLLRAAQYPARTVAVADGDGNAVYLSYGQGGFDAATPR